VIYKLGTVMGHIGHAPPETERWSILKVMNIDVDLARKALHKLYFEEVHYDSSLYEICHDVYFIPNDTKYGSLFAMKYGTLIDDR
jgi:chemotaxis protein CheY-P-specific phosphatase CheC